MAKWLPYREDKQFDPFAETPVDGVIAAQCSVQVVIQIDGVIASQCSVQVITFERESSRLLTMVFQVKSHRY